MAGMYKTLIEENLFTTQLKELGDIQHLDETLRAVTWALCRQPEAFPIVPGTEKLRLIKTVGAEVRNLEKFRIWFYIKDKNSVVLLSIEKESE